ncbi:DUF7471 family protein [Salinirussus salinus]|jgi:hypothetical protein|uniref:DUF7471 family protein n=1 Tax=Salinirussus salinus TaxID=1198300 RepID=UPI001F23EC7D|nr:hypothetical protein [Salinirussus salinus]
MVSHAATVADATAVPRADALSLADAVPLHAGGGVASDPPWVLAVVALATVATAALLGLTFAAYVRRKSRSYLLVVAAVAALLARSVVAGVTFAGMVSPAGHHLLEHGLDVVLVGLVVGAVYYARTVEREGAAT